MAESVQQHARAYGVDTEIRKAAKPTLLPDVPSTLLPDELARLYDVDQELPWRWRLGPDEVCD